MAIRKLSNQDWINIEKLWAQGNTNCEIARRFKISETLIRTRAKRERWERIEDIVVRNIVTKNIPALIRKTHAKMTPEEVDEDMMYTHKRIFMQAMIGKVLDGHRIIIDKTYDMLVKNEYRPHEAAMVFKTLGLNVSDIAHIMQIALDIKDKQINADNKPVIVLQLANADDSN